MNALLSEHLILRGKKMVLETQPLLGFFQINGHPCGLGGHPRWRGYAATWEIQDGHLYLVAVDGGQYVGLDTLFPSYPDGVFAHWYTGELRCPSGQRLQISGRLNSVLTEFDVFIAVNKGVVTKERVVKNSVAPLEDDDPTFEAEYQKLMSLPRNAHLRKKD
jgi:hypothetical protein